MVAGVWNVLRVEGYWGIHASLSQCSPSTWDYWNINCFVCFFFEGLVAHLDSHFVWTDRLGILILFLPSLCLLLLTVQWLKPLGLCYLWKTEVAPKQTTVPILGDFRRLQFSALYALRDFPFRCFLSARLLCHCGFSCCICVPIHDSQLIESPGVMRVSLWASQKALDLSALFFVYPPGHGAFLLEKEKHVHCADTIQLPGACTPVSWFLVRIESIFLKWPWGGRAWTHMGMFRSLLSPPHVTDRVGSTGHLPRASWTWLAVQKKQGCRESIIPCFGVTPCWVSEWHFLQRNHPLFV